MNFKAVRLSVQSTCLY